MNSTNIAVMDVIVNYLGNGYSISDALKMVYTKRHVAIPFETQHLDYQVADLNMSNRTTLALRRGGLHTVASVVAMGHNGELKKIRCLGQKSAIELYETLLNYFWEHMTITEKTDFLIDTVIRNSENLKDDWDAVIA